MPHEPSDEKPGIDPDAELMLQVARGSDEAFVALIRKYQQSLQNFFARMDAYIYGDWEDLVQETFVRLYRYRERYRPKASFKTFLYVLARHGRC